MDCERTGGLLHGYLDGELDAAGAEDFERHLPGCAPCRAELEAQQALRARFEEAALFAPAPAELRARVRAQLPAALPAPGPAAGPRWRWLAVAASVAFLSVAAWTLRGPGPGGEAGLAGAALDAHLRALQAHPTDVASTDSHTVKPWFEGKLDYSPPVVDLTADGFPLIGGRLDVLEGRTVAALVYGRRKHVLSAFVWPADGAADAGPQAGGRQGYAWIRWTHAGMRYWVVSDVAPGDLDDLARLLRQAPAAPARE